MHTPLRQRFVNLRISGRALILASIAVSLAICATATATLHDLRLSTYESARLANSNIVAPMESEIARNIELYDLSLQAVIDGVLLPEIHEISADVRQHVLFDRSATAKHLGEIRVLDEKGRIRFDSRDSYPQPVDLSSRDYFRAHQYKSDAGLFVGLPFVDPRGHRVIGISRRLSHPDGRFAGVVVGTLRLSYLDELFRKVTLKGSSSITLIHLTGLIVSRLPHNSELMGRAVSNTEIYDHITAGPSGHFEALTRFDNQVRLFSFRRVGSFPLVLTVATPVNEVLAGWRWQALIIGAVVGTLCAVAVLLSAVAARELKHRTQVEAELALLATTDELTGLANRRSFDQALDREWQRALRGQTAVALLMIDADHFKDYNDRHGHQAGDKALSTLAICIANSTRSVPDLAARYGGEEFAVLLPGASVADAADVADRIHRNILQLNETMSQRTPIPTVSVGVSAFKPVVGIASSALLQSADRALYAAKERGRNRTETAPESVAATARLRVVNA